MVTGTDEAIEDPDGDGGVDPRDGNQTMIPGSGQDQGSPDDVKGEECLVGSGNGQIGQLGVWRNAAAESSGPPAQPFQAKGAVDKQEDEGDDAPLEVFLPAKAGQNGPVGTANTGQAHVNSSASLLAPCQTVYCGERTLSSSEAVVYIR